MEARGMQALWMKQTPEVLMVLREQAVIQSTESSNRIEGVTISADRLRPVVLLKSKPRDRPEEELAGYRRALDWIFNRKRTVTLTPAVIQYLHAVAHAGLTGDAGQWKTKNNDIVEILPNCERHVRFSPTPAKDTPHAITQLCSNYQRLLDDANIPELICIATLVFDFLCIHPFRDGNGRVSRLLTTLLLQQQGFGVARYVSLERLVEETKESYYQTLAECSQGWHQGKNSIVPWWNYFLSTLRRAYHELKQQVSLLEARPAKGALVRQTILDQVDQFTLADLAAQLPAVSTQLIKKQLLALKQEKKVQLSGRGRGALWRVRAK